MRIPFEFRHLYYFVAVAEELNFRRAAERLSISQPPLSRQIREFEAIVGARLLERSTTAVKLTPPGELALRRARQLLAEADVFSSGLHEADRLGARPRVALSVAIPATNHSALISGWKAALDAESVQLETGETKHLLPRLRQRQVDFALVGAPNNFGGLESEIVHTVPLVVTLPAKHAAARKRVVSLKDMADLPLFWFTRAFNPPYFDHCAKVFEAVGYRPPVIPVPPGQLSTLERISRGEGFSLLTAGQVPMKIAGVTTRPLKEGKALGFNVVAAWKSNPEDAQQPLRAKRFAAVARSVLNAKAKASS
jgi:DNA-binding transcriptional LysR family regulator